MIKKFINIKYLINTKNIGSSSYCINSNRICDIYNIRVSPEYRNNNIGSKLLKDIELDCYTKNVNRINLVSYNKENNNLSDFYLKNGYLFENKHEEREVYIGDTNYILRNMYKILH